MNRYTRIIMIIVILLAFITTSLGLTSIVVKSIKLNTSSIKISIGKTYKLKVTFTPENATNKKVIFASANRKIAIVDKEGNIKGIIPGKTVVTVTSTSNKKAVARCNVTISQASRITFSVWTAQNSRVEDIKTNKLTKRLEEHLNIKFNFILVPGTGAADQLNLLLSSGSDLPDIFMAAPNISYTQLAYYGKEGLFISLNDYIDKHGVNIKRVLNDHPGVIDTITSPDGKIYSLPGISESVHWPANEKAWINTKWLKKLGLSVPKTTDELFNVLKEFKEKDPNSNQKQDEVPAVNAGGEYCMEAFLINPFGFFWATPSADGRFGLEIDNGKVEASYIKPEFKNGLRYMNKLYKEGLIDKECFTTNPDQLIQLTESPDGCKVGFAFTSVSLTFCDLSKDTKWDFEILEPVKGPSGFTATPGAADKVATPGRFVITKTCKYPEEAFKLGDFLMSDKNEYRDMFIGDKGVFWKENTDGRLNWKGMKAPWISMYNNIWSNIQNEAWPNIGPYYNKLSTNQNYYLLPDKSKGEYNIDYICWKGSQAYQKYVIKNRQLPLLIMKGKDEQTRMMMLTTEIEKYVAMSIARFTTGEMSVDADWDKYVNEFKNLNLNEVLKMWQNAIDSKK